MPVIINGTTGITDVNGTAAAPALTGTDTDTGIFFPAANTLAFSTNGTEDARFDASGNFGLGVTPSAWSASFKAIQLGTKGAFYGSTSATVIADNVYNDGSAKYLTTAAAGNYVQSGGTHYWQIAGSGTAGNAITFTQAMTLDASGNLGVGTTSPAYKVEVKTSTAASIVDLLLLNNGGGSNGGGAGLRFEDAGAAARVAGVVFGPNENSGLGLGFYTSSSAGSAPTEKARIDSSGNLQVGLTNIASYVGSSPVGSIANVASTNATNSAAFIHSTTGVPYGPFVYFSGASPNNTTSYFLQCSDTTNSKAFIYSNGTFGSRTSTYGGISDIKVKQDIVDASSQWNDIKALQFRKYRFKDDPTGPLQLGLISQEAELVSPGLVFETPDTTMDEEGNRVETGEVTKSVKYSILYMKAVVALQEAMNRIEQLEADVASLKGNA